MESNFTLSLDECRLVRQWYYEAAARSSCTSTEDLKVFENLTDHIHTNTPTYCNGTCNEQHCNTTASE